MVLNTPPASTPPASTPPASKPKPSVFRLPSNFSLSSSSSDDSSSNKSDNDSKFFPNIDDCCIDYIENEFENYVPNQMTTTTTTMTTTTTTTTIPPQEVDCCVFADDTRSKPLPIRVSTSPKVDCCVDSTLLSSAQADLSSNSAPSLSNMMQSKEKEKWKKILLKPIEIPGK